VVDISALLANLKNGKNKGAAVDVFPKSKSNDEPFVSGCVACLM
jgi:D-3-phosphoglycerate dehydrogenase